MGERIVTTAQAAELRVKWNLRVDPEECEHLNLELEWSDNGYMTGNYNCILCGESVAQKPNHPIQTDPLSPSR
jgi:hypothetical protein